MKLNNWQFISIVVLVLFTLLAQVKSYGSLEEKVKQDQNAVINLTNKIERLTIELGETNIQLGMIRGYIEARKGINGTHASR